MRRHSYYPLILACTCASLLFASCTQSKEVAIRAEEPAVTTTTAEVDSTFVVSPDDLDNENRIDESSVDVTSPTLSELAKRAEAEAELDLSELTDTVKALEGADLINGTPDEPTSAEIAKLFEAAANAQKVNDALNTPTGRPTTGSAVNDTPPQNPTTTTPSPSSSTPTTTTPVVEQLQMGVKTPRIEPGKTQIFTLKVTNSSPYAGYQLAACNVEQLFTTASDWVAASWQGQLFCSEPSPINEDPASIIMLIPDSAPVGFYTACVSLSNGAGGSVKQACNLYEVIEAA